MSPVFRSRSPVASPRRIHSSPGLFNQGCRCWLRSASQQYTLYCEASYFGSVSSSESSG